MDDIALDVGEAEISAGVTVGKLGVVESQDVKDGGVEVVDMYLIADDVIAGFIGGAMHETRFNTTAGEPG